MAATPSPAWKGLPSTDDSWLKNTKLFFTFQKREEGPKLQVTDLVYIWTAAKTSREELTEEAARTRCSIDPSEDEEQYNVLLSKLEEAVAGQNGGMVTVVGYGNASTSFEMEASIPLPTPLGMLEWTFSMVRGKPAVFTQEVVVPALHAVETRRRREEELRRKIKEKDHVIGKLMDKIESSSIDLSMVFPGFAGARKGLNSRQAAKVVPGIEPFSGEGWEGKSLVGNDAGVGGIIEALRDPETGELKWKALLDLMVSATGDEENSNVPIGSVESSKQNQTKAPNRLDAHEDGSDSSEIGKSRERPSRRSSSSSSSPAPLRSRETTSVQRPPKLGALGMIKSKPVPVSKPKSVSYSPERPTKASRKLSSRPTGSATGSEMESESGHSTAHTKQATQRKATSKLGIIGGKKPQTSTRGTTKSPEPADRPTSQSTPSKGKSRLGTVGGKKEKTTSPPVQTHDSTASPTPSPPSVSASDQPVRDLNSVAKRSESPLKPEEPLTEAARANQKRLELKRQLDQGAGKKKKRKF